MMLSAKHGDPQLGIDIHLCTVPPSPSPVPLPVPHLSIVFDPFDYVPFIGATVSVCGMKRATAGTSAITIHIPIGFPFVPMLPEKDDELFMGSSSVIADDDPFSYMAMPVLGCQLVGMPSPPRPKKKRIPKPTLLPTTVNLAIPTNVFVGGAPTISMAGLAAAAAFKGLGKLAKSKLGQKFFDAFKKARQKLFKNMNPGFLKCKVLRAEPVNILTGEVSVEQEDFTLSGRMPIQWVRSYTSNNRRKGFCGYGWETPADARLEVDSQDGSVMFRHPIGGPALFPTLPDSTGDEGAVLELMDGSLLSDHGTEFRVRTKEDLIYHFPKALLSINDEGLHEYAIGRIANLFGEWLEFDRRDGRLVGINESAGRRLSIDIRDGLIRSVGVYVPETGFEHTFVRYEYDLAGNLAAALDALGNPYKFVYDHHHMVQHTNRNGLSFYYDFDKSGETWRVVHAWGDGGLYDYRFEYFDAIGERRISNSLGHVSTVQCDERGLPILETDPLSGRTIFEYDDAGRTTAVVAPGNHRTTYEYDERGNLLALTRPDGKKIATEFDASNKATQITDPNGAVWRQRWNERGLLLEQKSPLGAISTYEYDNYGQPINFINPRDAETQFAFDANGALTSVTDALGNVTRFERDDLGNLLTRTDPLGRITRYGYDVNERLMDVVLPNGAGVSCAYDAQGQLTRYVDEGGAITSFEYFGQGLIKRRIQPDGHAVEYHYDTEEQLIGVTNQRGETYALKRDALGRVLEEVDYWGQSTIYQFDAAGSIQQSTDPLGRTIQYTTDPLGRIRRKAFAHPETPGKTFEETFDYDANGKMVKTANPHITVTRKFDVEGRLIEEAQGDFKITNTYDAVGNRIKRETSAGNTVAYSYDQLDQVVDIQINDSPPIEIERDDQGQIVREKLNDKLTRHYQYDVEGRRTAQGLQSNDEWRFTTRYSYDASGNMTQRSDSEFGVDQFRYDPLGQILEHTDPQGKLTRFFNDPAGDRLTTQVVRGKRAVGGDGDEWVREGRYSDGTEIFGAAYRFDRAGNLIFREDDKRAIYFTWDANQRLVKSETNGVVTRYGYDPLGRRVFKETEGRRTGFWWDGDALIAEEIEEGSESVVPVNGNRELVVAGQTVNRRSPTQKAKTFLEQGREYVYYPGSFEPLALVDNGPGQEHVYYYQNDPNGCPTRLTRADGGVVWAARHEVWGRPQLLVNEIGNPLRLQGQYEDEETGLHYNRYRYYDPHAGMYVSADPLGLYAGENLCNIAPNTLGWIDPLGLEERMPTWMPTRSLYQRQHIIPHSLRNHPIFVKSGLSINAPSNMMYLPMFQWVTNNPLIGLHRGWTQEHKQYNELVEIYLDDLDDLAHQQGWSHHTIQHEIHGLQSELRRGSRDGRFTCAT
jgi:RHS repeat-associated protein